MRGFYSKVFDGIEGMRPVHISLYMFLLNQNNRKNWAEWFKCPFDTAMEGALINSSKTYYAVLQDLQDFGFIRWKKGVNLHKAPQINIINLGEVDDIVPIPEDITEVVTPVEITNLTTRLTTILTTNLSSTQCITLLTTLCTTLSATLSSNRDILITDNSKPITDNNKQAKNLFAHAWEKFGLGVRAMIVDTLEQPEEEKEKKVAPKKEKAQPPEKQEFMTYTQIWMNSTGKDFEGKKHQIESKFDSWIEAGWKDGHGKPIKDWKGKIRNTEPYLKSDGPRKNFNNGNSQKGIDLGGLYSKIHGSPSDQ